LKKIVRSLLHGLGFDITRRGNSSSSTDSFVDLTDDERDILRTVKPFTMASLDRLVAVIHSVKHIVRHKVPGDLVECGVWRGGSMMAAALTLRSLGEADRSLYLYDTFEGMSVPTSRDRSFEGKDAAALLSQAPAQTGIWCYASLEDVHNNLLSTGYPKEKLVFVKGKVEDTIPAQMPREISLLRLDTDWYESTRHELTHLYPRLSFGGTLIIDDYGHWQGARAAVDEYFSGRPEAVYLHRIDYTGRIAIKPFPVASGP
jgi:O-methyltransferase